MKKAIAILFALVPLSFGLPDLTLIPSLGPALGSVNQVGSGASALYALRNNLSTYGTAGPAQYNRHTGNISLIHIIDTYGAFPSWQGVVNPAAPFDTEYGSALHFSLRAVGADASDLFSLNQVVYVNHFLQPGVPYPFDSIFDLYDGENAIGVLSGPDGQLGGGDDILLDGNQPGDTQVNALFHRGLAATIPLAITFTFLPPQDQLAANAFLASFEATSLYPGDPDMEACIYPADPLRAGCPRTRHLRSVRRRSHRTGSARLCSPQSAIA